MQITQYCKQRLKDRRYLKVEWCKAIIENPLKTEVQKDGRIVYWGWAPKMKGKIKILRVVTCSDGMTLHNVFPDRDYQMKLSQAQIGENLR